MVASSTFERHIYLCDAVYLTCGVCNASAYTVASPAAYNDGRWHLATGTFSPATGVTFYVDGVLIGANTATTAAESTSGYWRIGFDSLSAQWPGSPTSYWFAGSLAHAGVFERLLTADEVAGQYAAGR